jgi:hypothetical protein
VPLAWAKDEPETPTADEMTLDSERTPRPSITFLSHTSSSTRSDLSSNNTERLHGYNRWTFALANTLPKSKRARSSDSSEDEDTKDDKKRQAGPSRPSRSRWNSRKRSNTQESTESQGGERSHTGRFLSSTLRLQLPLPPAAPFTLSHTKTPGWDTPWTPRLPDHISNCESPELESGGIPGDSNPSRSKENLASKSQAKAKIPLRKKIRSYVLHNNYVPLVSFFFASFFRGTHVLLLPLGFSFHKHNIYHDSARDRHPYSAD